MNHRTRNFMVGSAAVLMVGLGAGLVAYYGGLPGLAARHAGPEELEYLPANAAVVAYADVGQVMRSDFRQRMQSVMPDEEKGKGRQEFEQATGIDVERDIDAVMAALVPGEGEQMPILAIRGRFDEGRIEAFAREHGATVELHQGIRVISMPEGRHRHSPAEADPDAAPEAEAPADEPEAEQPPDAPKRQARAHERPAMAFAESGLLVVGTPAGVRGAIDRKRNGQNLTANTELMGRIAKLEGGANAWAVGRMESLAERAHLPEEMAVKLPGLTWFEASGHVNGGISGLLKAEARDDESARNMRDMLNGLMALGRMQAPSNPQVQALMQSVTLGGSGRTIELTFNVPSEVIDAMMPKAKVKTIALQH